MARVPDMPRGMVDVDGDADAFEVRIEHAPEPAEPNEHGVATLADVVIRGRAGGVATMIVRGTDDVHYAAVVAREDSAGIMHTELMRLERRADDVYMADIAVAPGEMLHLTVVTSDFETGMLWLEATVAAGGMGMGGGPESAAEAAPAPPPLVPDDVLGGGTLGGGTLGGGTLGGGGFTGTRSPGLAPPTPAPTPPPAAAPAPGPAAPPATSAPPTGATPGPGAPGGGLDGASPVPAFVDAEIPARLVDGVEFDAVVRLSREDLVPTAGTARQKATARFDPTREIEVGVQLRGLAFADGTLPVVTTTLPATPEETRRLVFRLRPEEPGRGHITVTFTQPPVVAPLAVLALSAPVLPPDADPGEPGADDPRVVTASVAAPPRSIADLPTLVIDESIAGGASDLLITAKIGGTVVKNTVHLAKKAEYIQGIYAELTRIRSTYLETVRDDPQEAEEAADTVRREVRSLGARIARELLGDDVNRLLWNRRRRISHLVLQTSGELDIPWEVVHLVPVGTQRPDKERFFLGDLGLTRWMYGTVRPTVIPIDARRVVAIAPDYVNPKYELPRAREEVTTLGQLLARGPRSAADPVELRQVIADGFDLLHFAGHGRWRDVDPLGQEIAFATFSEDHDDGSASYTDSDARRDLPELEGPAARASAPFVFLSACDVGRLRSGATGLGGFAEVFLRGGAGVFIGCSWAVRDDVTSAFVRTFYEKLLGDDHATVGEAVLTARHAAREAGDLTSLAFTVFADPRAKLVTGAPGDDS